MDPFLRYSEETTVNEFSPIKTEKRSITKQGYVMQVKKKIPLRPKNMDNSTVIEYLPVTAKFNDTHTYLKSNDAV